MHSITNMGCSKWKSTHGSRYGHFLSCLQTHCKTALIVNILQNWTCHPQSKVSEDAQWPKKISKVDSCPLAADSPESLYLTPNLCLTPHLREDCLHTCTVPPILFISLFWTKDLVPYLSVLYISVHQTTFNLVHIYISCLCKLPMHEFLEQCICLCSTWEALSTLWPAPAWESAECPTHKTL